MVYFLRNIFACLAMWSDSMAHTQRLQRTQLQSSLSCSSGLWAKAVSLGLGFFLWNRNASWTSLTMCMARGHPKHRGSEQTIHGRSTNGYHVWNGKNVQLHEWVKQLCCRTVTKVKANLTGALTQNVCSDSHWWEFGNAVLTGFFSLWHQASDNVIW